MVAACANHNGAVLSTTCTMSATMVMDVCSDSVLVDAGAAARPVTAATADSRADPAAVVPCVSAPAVNTSADSPIVPFA